MTRLWFLVVLVGCHARDPAPVPLAQRADPAVVVSDAVKARVAELIKRLPEVAGGFYTFDRDPIMSQLLAIGDPAVEPLIAVLESDERTTQAHFDKEREYEKDVRVPVHRVAYWALQHIIESTYFASDLHEILIWREGKAGRAKVAAELRALWKTSNMITREERWYRTLADDHASPADWVAAAAKILGRVEQVHYYDPFDVATPGLLRGEALRRHPEPTVTQLLQRRIKASELRDGCELARLFGRWDVAAAKPVLVTQMNRALAASQGSHEFGNCIWSLAVVRAELGDPGALDDYATWIATTPPPIDNWNTSQFQPMWHYKRPSLDKASEVIFGPGSTWIPIIPSTPTPGASHRAQVLDQRLYGVIGFQRHVIAALGDNRIVGTVDTSGGGHWGVKMLGGWSFSTSTEDPAVPAGSTSAPVRARDYYAYKVAHQTGAPNFELYWPLTRRDAAIVAALAWVTAQH